MMGQLLFLTKCDTYANSVVGVSRIQMKGQIRAKR